MGKINVGLIVCLGLSTFYFMRQSANHETTNTWLMSENRCLSDDNHALRDIIVQKATAKTYEDGITDALVRLNGPHGQTYSSTYVTGYHAAMADAQASAALNEKPAIEQGDNPKKPETDKVSKK